MPRSEAEIGLPSSEESGVEAMNSASTRVR